MSVASIIARDRLGFASPPKPPGEHLESGLLAQIFSFAYGQDIQAAFFKLGYKWPNGDFTYRQITTGYILTVRDELLYYSTLNDVPKQGMETTKISLSGLENLLAGLPPNQE